LPRRRGLLLPCEVAGQLLPRLQSGQIDAAGYAAEAGRIAAERQHLAELPSVPATTRLQPAGLTIGQAWNALGTAGRRAELLESGVRVYFWSARRSESGRERVRVETA
jgi:hypothetical protein